MTYTGSSCEDIYNNSYCNPETGDKSGCYQIGTKWTYCNMTEIAAGLISTCAGTANGLKMSEYRVYWLTDFPLIIY